MAERPPIVVRDECYANIADLECPARDAEMCGCNLSGLEFVEEDVEACPSDTGQEEGKPYVIPENCPLRKGPLTFELQNFMTRCKETPE